MIHDEARPTTGTARKPIVVASGLREREMDWLSQKASAVASGPLYRTAAMAVAPSDLAARLQDQRRDRQRY